METFPSAAHPGGTVGVGVAGIVPAPESNETYGAYGWVVTLNDTTITQGGLNFSNVLFGCLQITKSLSIPAGTDLRGINGTFTIHVAGPNGYATDVSFTMVNGVITSTNPVELDNLVPGNYTLTEPTPPAGWTPSGLGTVPVSAGSTCATITVTNTFATGCLLITKSLVLTGYQYPTAVNETFTVHVTGPNGYSHDVTFTVAGGVITSTNPVELDNLVPGTYNVSETAPSDGMWTITGGGSVTVNAGTTCATSTITNTIKLPHTTLTIAAPFVTETTQGENVVLTIHDTNDGAVPIVSGPQGTPHIHVFINGVQVTGSPFGNAGGTFPAGTGYLAGTVTFIGETGGTGSNTDNIMDVGETWTWQVSVTITATASFTIYGGGYDALGNEVDGPVFPAEVGNVTVQAIGTTRTQGFWATHLDFTTYVFNTYIIGNPTVFPNGIDLGYTQVKTIPQLMGIFWANNAKNSDGSKRSQLCQARETAANQALAAILNSAIPGGKPLPTGYGLSQIASILGGTNINAINTLNSVLDAFNSSGDNVAFSSLLPPTGKANPQGAKAIADIPFADCK